MSSNQLDSVINCSCKGSDVLTHQQQEPTHQALNKHTLLLQKKDIYLIFSDFMLECCSSPITLLTYPPHVFSYSMQFYLFQFVGITK